MQKKRPTVIVVFITLIYFQFPIHAQQNLIDTESKALLQHLSADSMYQHVLALGNDSLQGRATGSPGGDKAANYIAMQLSKIGLETAGDNQTYFQNIPMHGSQPQPDSKLSLSIKDTVLALTLWQDYILFNTGARGSIIIPSKREDTYLDWSYWVRQFRFQDVRLLYGMTDNLVVRVIRV